MGFQRLVLGPVPRTNNLKQRQADLYQNRFRDTNQPLQNTALEYAFQTYMLAPQSIIGAATHAPRHPQAYGSPPMLSRRTVQIRGLPRQAGTFLGTPLSENPGADA